MEIPCSRAEELARLSFAMRFGRRQVREWPMARRARSIWSFDMANCIFHTQRELLIAPASVVHIRGELK